MTWISKILNLNESISSHASKRLKRNQNDRRLRNLQITLLLLAKIEIAETQRGKARFQLVYYQLNGLAGCGKSFTLLEFDTSAKAGVHDFVGVLDARFRGHDIKKTFSAAC